MSIKVMSWVFENGPKDPSERLVLLALADYATDNGEWSPSMIGIAEKAGMTERGARGVIRRLEDGGWIEVRVGGGRGGRSHYRVLMGRAANPEPETRNDKPGMTNPERHVEKPGTKRPETRNQRSAEPSGTIKEPSEKNISDALRCEFEAFWAEVPRKAAKDRAFPAYAKARKKASAETILSGIRRYAAERRGQDPKFTSHPASWLNGGRWGDEPEQQKFVQIQGGNHGKPSTSNRMDAFIAGAVGSPGVDRGPHPDPSQPLLARR